MNATTFCRCTTPKPRASPAFVSGFYCMDCGRAMERAPFDWVTYPDPRICDNTKEEPRETS